MEDKDATKGRSNRENGRVTHGRRSSPTSSSTWVIVYVFLPRCFSFKRRKPQSTPNIALREATWATHCHEACSPHSPHGDSPTRQARSSSSTKCKLQKKKKKMQTLEDLLLPSLKGKINCLRPECGNSNRHLLPGDLSLSACWWAHV